MAIISEYRSMLLMVGGTVKGKERVDSLSHSYRKCGKDMTFKDVDGVWPDLASSFASLCAAFMIVIAVLWLGLVVMSGPPIILGPSDPFTVFIVPILGPTILLLMGVVVLLISMKSE